MTSPALSFQTLIYAAIRAAMPTARIGAHVPNDTALPYIHIAHSDSEPASDDAEKLTQFVDTWSSLDGPHEIKELQEAIKTAVVAIPLTHGIYAFSVPLFEYTNVVFDMESNCWHGMQRIITFTVLE